MIEIELVVREDQGEPSGFDLGDVTLTGEQGTVSSAGRVPDQGVMIWITATGLVDGVRQLPDRGAADVRVAGIDSSFDIEFSARRGVVSVSAMGEVAGTSTVRDLRLRVNRAAERLLADGPVPVRDLAAVEDLRAALAAAAESS